MKTAYKNIPQHPSIWPSQAMFWLGKFFIDISTVFGSRAAPSQFDVFSSTVQFLAEFLSQANPFAILRQLDDLIVLSPAWSNACQLFTETYRHLCSILNIRLADPCPKFEKAFENSTHGLVLGLYFDSKNMTWSLPQYKFSRYIRAIDSFLMETCVSLHETQSLAGSLNDFALFSPFFKAFKGPFLFFIHKFTDDPSCRLRIPHSVRKDLYFWREAINAAKSGFPLSMPPQNPPFTALHFYSDAAAGVFPMYEKFPSLYPPRGAASLGGISPDCLWFACRLTWPPALLSSIQSSESVLFGHKSTTLEAIAVALPLLLIPDLCRQQHICFFTDNKAVVGGWENRYLIHDPESSLWLRCLSVIEAYLDAHFYFFHSPRNSSPITTLADKLTRDPSPLPPPAPPIRHLTPTTHPILFNWLSHPILDWSLPSSLLSELSLFSG
jgi:hypothetical protein